MEKGGGVGGGGLEIRVPRPEDAGLEDCALSPGSIMEAFSRAAAVSFGSCLSIQEDGQHEDDNDDDDGPTNTENHLMADKDVMVLGGEEAVNGDVQAKQGKEHDNSLCFFTPQQPLIMLALKRLSLVQYLTFVSMANYSGRGGHSNGSVYVCNLPPGTDESMLAEYFGTIGLLKKDKRTGRPKIWLYKDKVTDEPKGDATVTYEDPHAALAAVEWFHKKDFHGSFIEVYIAELKNKDSGDQLYSQQVNALDPREDVTLGGEDDMNAGGGRGRGRGDASAKSWQQDGDWSCPNTSCSNVNFAFRGVCNRCGTARPVGAGGTGAGAGGRGRGRGSNDASGRGRPVGAPTGLFGPNDWSCPMCANINWAKRMKCNVCNTNKPGHNEGGVRGGRAGGYKELDEEEIEETRRRRREAEEDDGEMYDEFGNLKKKFRAKTQQAEAGQALPGLGRAGWEVEDLGVSERNGREKSRGRGRDYNNREDSRVREREGHGHERERHRSREAEREKDGRGRSRDRDYDYKRGREYGRESDRHQDW